jgi:hypothetical protein
MRVWTYVGSVPVRPRCNRGRAYLLTSTGLLVVVGMMVVVSVSRRSYRHCVGGLCVDE